MIRLARFGAKKRPFYRVVVSPSAAPREGKFLDVVGTYDPQEGTVKAKVNREKVDLWLKRGARPTEAVKQILKRATA